MADREAAGLFGMFFGMLAENPTDEHRDIAARCFDESKQYDFSYDQMGSDEALLRLGLAKMAVDKRYPDDGPVIHYGPKGKRSP